jgi:diguanylate cyclase (GGDEF)-like protein/PAS domain S-box-containing protein
MSKSLPPQSPPSVAPSDPDALRRAFTAQTTENAALRKRMALLVEGACDVMMVVGRDHKVVEASRRTVALYEADGQTVIGTVLDELIADEDREKVVQAVESTLQTGTSRSVRARLPQQGQRWFRLNTSLYETATGVSQVYIAGHDITEFKSAESALVYQAMHDSLTGLPNRSLMEDRIRREIESFRRTGAPFAVLMLDLDGFKKANDSLGHAAGDEILKQTATRLVKLLRGTDTVARLGGDEFVIVLPGVSQACEIEPVALRILSALQQPYPVGTNTLYLTTSVGAALYPAHGEELAELLSNADMAMYKAKELGKDRWSLFQDQLRAKSTRTVSLEAALYEGVSNGEFMLHYQPICNATTGVMAGVEALMRWNRPGHGLVSPAEFIPVVEANGLINLLGAWALQLSAMQLARWDAEGMKQVYASVNVSPRQFRHSQFLSAVRKAIDMSKVDPSRLVLEITEGVLMQDPESARKTLQELVAMGLRVSVDDFGTGYSSLAYLQRFPLHALKIDRSFVQHLPGNTSDAAIVNAVLALARETGLKVVAEGVELESQRAYLADKGCDYVQGWLMGRPIPAPDLSKILAKGDAPLHALPILKA